MQIVEKLLLLKKACGICGKKEFETAIDRYIENRNRPISIMLVGEGKHGKTCLLNGLLGRNVAKEGLGIKSANKNYYRNVSGKQYVSRKRYDLENGDIHEISCDKQLQHEYEEYRREKTENVYWSLNLEWPGQDIIVIDTEGFNQSNDHLAVKNSKISLTTGAEVIYRDLFDDIYSEADLIVWCVKGQYCDSTIEKFKRVKVYNKPIFLVYTFADEEIENEDLEEIETPEDLIEDMHVTLGEITEKCIKDFAGFAGDNKNPERKKRFLEELQAEIDSYIKHCNNGFKNEVGERLYQGIYQELLEAVQLEAKSRYEILSDYYYFRDDLTDRMKGLQEEYTQRLSVLLEKLNQSIDHDSLYIKAYEDSERSYKKSFVAITRYYDDLFLNETALHKVIDEILPEKIRLLEDEFIFNKSMIDDTEYERADCSDLWNQQKKMFRDLYSEAQGWGIFENWKKAKFQEYFKNLSVTWKELIQKLFSDILKQYDQGFREYIQKEFQVLLAEFVEQSIENEWMEQCLMDLGQKEKEESESQSCNCGRSEKEDSEETYCAYGLKERKKVVCLFGHRNQIYGRYFNGDKEMNLPKIYFPGEYSQEGYSSERYSPERYSIEKILAEQYIERDLWRFERNVDQFIKEYSRSMAEESSMNKMNEAYEKLQTYTLKDVVDIPEAFDELRTIKEEIHTLKKANNFDRDKVQEFYKKRVEILQDYCTIRLNNLCSDIGLEIKEKAVQWVQENVTDQLEKEFNRWKNNFWNYLSRYCKKGEAKPVVYYDFTMYLEKRETEVTKLYTKDPCDEWETMAREFLRKNSVKDSCEQSENRYIQEIKIAVKNLKLRADNEAKRQYAQIKAANRKICMDIMQRYLMDMKRVALRISYFAMIQAEAYESEYSMKKKIRALSGLQEKSLLLNEYSEIQDKLFGEFCSSPIYSEIKTDLKERFNQEKKQIFSECIKNAQGGKNG